MSRTDGGDELPDKPPTFIASPNDIAQWGEKDMSGAYAPGTVMNIAGRLVRIDELHDRLGGELPDDDDGCRNDGIVGPE